MNKMKALQQRTEIVVPIDFLTTVTINTFRPQYYFSQDQTVGVAAEVHRRYKGDPRYQEYIERVLPVMLSSHKVLCAIYLFDQGQDVTNLLEQARPDHMPTFWLNILDFHKELGLQRTSLGRRGRNFVWRFLKHIAEKRGLRTVALWFTKTRKPWRAVCYRAHTKFKGDLGHLAAGLLFKRKGHLEQVEDEQTRSFLDDFVRIQLKAIIKSLTIEDVQQSRLPFRTLEGFASGVLDTTSLPFYEAAFDKMTNYEVLRRTDAMRRCGFLDSHRNLWLQRMERAATFFDPAELGSVILQHPDLAEALRKPFQTCLEHTPITFPQDSVVLCDASRSMMLTKTNALTRVIWELAALVAVSQGIPTFLIRDVIEEVPKCEGVEGIAETFGTNEAYNPTSLSRGLEAVAKLKPRWLILITDGQSNIPYRGHEKLVAEKMKETTILTLNPTINPLEPEAATRLGAENEIFLPLRGLRFLGHILEVIKND